jgi:hypothetical protein
MADSLVEKTFRVPQSGRIPSRYWKETKSQKKRYAVLTFDDGYARTFALTAPVLQEEKVPATFFANTRNLDGKHLLWFVYFNALCSEQVYPRVKINGLTIPLDT